MKIGCQASMFASPFSHLFSFLSKKEYAGCFTPKVSCSSSFSWDTFFFCSFSVLSLKYISDGVSATLKFNSLLEPITKVVGSLWRALRQTPKNSCEPLVPNRPREVPHLRQIKSVVRVGKKSAKKKKKLMLARYRELWERAPHFKSSPCDGLRRNV